MQPHQNAAPQKSTKCRMPWITTHPLLPQVEKEIQSMFQQGVISPVTELTAWCSAMVTVPKPNSLYRICVDLTQLNRCVQREIHPLSSVDESLTKLSQSKIFLKLIAKSGFWQIPLDEESWLVIASMACPSASVMHPRFFSAPCSQLSLTSKESSAIWMTS